MVGSMPSGWMRRILLFLVLMTGILLIAMYAHAPPLASLQPFATRRRLEDLQRGLVNYLVGNETTIGPGERLYEYLEEPRTFQSPWSWACVANRCERRAVRSSRTSLATCTAHCGGNTRLLWPRPTESVVLGDDSVILHLQQIEFVTVNTSDQETKDLLEHAKDVFIGNVRSLVKVLNAKSRSGIDSFIVYLSAGNARGTLTLDTDESYKLEVTPKGKVLEARITGRSYFGVRHGLETLSQLIWWDEATGKQGALRVLTRASIEDKPAFPYRGLLVDTGRQFFPVEELKRVIDGMAATKLNTLHWHLTDSQSFPFDSAQFPEMARWGAYSGDHIYTPDDVKDLADYARIRGVRIVVEIDSPAHAGAGWQWGAEHGFGELALCVDQQPWSSYCGEPNCGQLNPINEHSYRILEGLYRELLDLTEVRDLVHLGGDEVNLECWAQYGNITLAMQAQNMTDHHALWAEFETKMLQRLIRANHDKVPKAVILWSSPLTKRPYIMMHFDPKIHVIQSWGGSNWPETPDLLEDGFRVILSHVDAWYLDCGFGRWRESGEAACGEYRTWQTVYNHRPWKDYPPQQLPLVLGGEAAIWSEQTGQSSLGPRLWPRASALAERLWSDLPTNSYSTDENVYTRLAMHVEVLNSRGIKTESMWPQWCSQNPGKCL
ncbi:PREDICTED: probable beta-hexosaminidase fdl isoform X4 [Vollenhovia emeryi]|nr:PREDICTED: probable beta-hexosaminidase fdl isoform X4 [Vollenhovia emeryi]XP_011862034.1 PREDICTED: probable beta-hexosaminidase fdl isoform X4 [Vollenhovia emeryi]XP_011862035.1 PREDICTED: probable beta-hexosaminidase fdl isoform X4 [Vollenhovia emeryi]XP_011862036.1 PREDICTED: probable beta-hexosaminidase fdl isoform X4 [Vollenhovia emeryi]XP_011862037.1 PREDICTED: probable beta-hexosaminidase fdl isoform X4 [Vollenhovia emeryi]XP_011862038.1 PREDICTED: probable beta-hexosaminidase fdl i